MSERGEGSALPILTVLTVVTILWYAGAILLNAPQVRERLDRSGSPWVTADLMTGAWSMDRPVLPAPHQIVVELYKTVVEQPVTSKRSLIFHAEVTASATLAGFILGVMLGILLSLGIVALPTLDRSLMPWIIASQTVPVLAIAPMVVVVLGSLGFTGLLPKAVISGYLSFFPVVIG